jgi:LPXTG-motif cell wall-anchored protein
MDTGEIIAIIIIAVIISLSALAIIISKKKGKKCIGCPYSCECSKKNCNSNKKA